MTGVYGFIRHRNVPRRGVAVHLYTFVAWLHLWSARRHNNIPLIAGRIIGEERFLIKELEGYSDYKKKVKFRLIPLIW